jgi:hypothetical protein
MNGLLQLKVYDYEAIWVLFFFGLLFKEYATIYFIIVIENMLGVLQ